MKTTGVFASILRDHVQEHGGIGAEARDERDLSGKEILDGEPQQRARIERGEFVRQPRCGDLVAEQREVGCVQMPAPGFR